MPHGTIGTGRCWYQHTIAVNWRKALDTSHYKIRFITLLKARIELRNYRYYTWSMTVSEAKVVNIDVCKTLMPPFLNICIIGLTFDLDIWPTDLNINRDHLLIKDYLPTKFGASGVKRSWVISCTRLRDTDIPTDMCNAICPSFFEGGHKYDGSLDKKRSGQIQYWQYITEHTYTIYHNDSHLHQSQNYHIPCTNFSLEKSAAATSLLQTAFSILDGTTLHGEISRYLQM